MTGNSKSGRRQNVIVAEPREIGNVSTEQSNWHDESFNSVMTESSRLRPMEYFTVLETSEEVSKVANQEVVDTSAASQRSLAKNRCLRTILLNFLSVKAKQTPAVVYQNSNLQVCVHPEVKGELKV